MQRRFVSDVSHELRTPLTTVRMAGDVLHDARARLRPGHRPRRRAAADRARPLRDAARRPARDQPLRRRRRRARRSRTSTSSTSRTGSSTTTRRWPSSAASASLVEVPAQPCLAEADVRRVERIVRNLVTNAIDHAEAATARIVRPAGRRRPRRRDRRARLRRRAWRRASPRMVFNRFWRADPARARTSGGTGLGLVDLARGHPPARRLAAGVGPPRRGRAVPADAAPPGRRAAAHSPLPLVPEDSPRASRSAMTPRPGTLAGRRDRLVACRAARHRLRRRCPTPAGRARPRPAVEPTGAARLLTSTRRRPTPGRLARPRSSTGFLDAQTAIPLQTNVAEQFLTDAEAATWRPQAATITYAAASPPERQQPGRASRSTGANRLDQRGVAGWAAARASEQRARLRDDPRGRRVAHRRRRRTRWSSRRRGSTSASARSRSTSSTPPARILVPEPVFVPAGRAAGHHAGRGAAGRPGRPAAAASSAAASRAGRASTSRCRLGRAASPRSRSPGGVAMPCRARTRPLLVAQLALDAAPGLLASPASG